jgi:ABC-2 type transport system permease protein
MKLLSVFAKSVREMRRELLVLSLSLVFAPFFVFLYWLLFPSGSTTYGVLVINDDRPVAGEAALTGGEDIVKAMEGVAYKNGNPLLKVSRVTDRAEAEARLRNRDAALLVIIPADFSRILQAARSGSKTVTTSVTFVGDLTNPYYTVAAVLSMGVADQTIQAATGQPRPILLDEVPLGASAARSEFENYVPGLMVFAVIMLVFPAAMTVAREIESGALRRLQLTRMTALDLLGGISASLVLVGAASVVLTCLTAWALGFRSEGRWWVAILVGAVTSLSVIGVGLLVACFSRTVTQAFLIANFPLGFFMFFSGTVFPIPHVPLFTLAGHAVGLYDVLPPTHAVVALNKVLTLGAGLGDVLYELAALFILSLVYFTAGVWLFQRTHLRAG